MINLQKSKSCYEVYLNDKIYRFPSKEEVVSFITNGVKNYSLDWEDFVILTPKRDWFKFIEMPNKDIVLSKFSITEDFD